MTDPSTKLNLGCGLHAPDGWYNMDRSVSLLLDRARPVKQVLHRVGLLTDAHMAEWPRSIHMRSVIRPLPFPDGSVEAIYSSHMLEHLYLSDARNVLEECGRVLRSGGVIRLALPDGERNARDLIDESHGAPGPRALAFTRGLNAHPEVRPGKADLPRKLLRGGPHRWQPTGGLVEMLLGDAGFESVHRCEFLVGDLPDLPSVEHREESLFMEAAAPAT